MLQRTLITTLSAVLTTLTISCRQDKPSVETKPAAVDSAVVQSIEDVKSTLGAIFNAARFYRNDYDKAPLTIEDLEREEYLYIDPEFRPIWSYIFVMEADSIRRIEAVSTPAMAGGAGYIISFDISSSQFQVTQPGG